jgi:hypothetical protein
VISEGKQYAVCRLSVACLWKHAAEDAPLQSQVLFGEVLEVINIKNKHWVRVLCSWDDELGWMDPKHLYFLKEKDLPKIKGEKHYSLELIYGIISDKISIPITIGALLHGFDGINVRMPFGRFQFSGQAFSPGEGSLTSSMFIKLAHKFINAPEMRGGRSVLGMDSGALTQLIYKLLDIELPRHPPAQSSIGEDIGFLEQAEIGDLAFFCKRNGPISHAGVIVGPGSVLHVHGRVKIDRLDQQGIYDLEDGRYSYKLRTVRRMIQLSSPEEQLINSET